MKSFRPFSALTYRNFSLFWLGQIISLTGTWMHSAGQGCIVLKLTDCPFYLGLVGSVSSMPILLFTLAGGVAADRLSKRKILLTTQMMLMLFAFILAVMVSTGIMTVWYFLVAVCFYINSLSFLAAIIALVRMKFNGSDVGKSSEVSVKEEFKEGLKYIFSEPKIYTLIILVGIISFFGFPYITFLPVYARDILKTGAAGLGILMSFAGAGAFIGAISLAIRGDFAKKGIFLAASGIIFSLSLLIFSLSTTTYLSYLMLFLVGWGAISQVAIANSLLQLTVPHELRGRVMSSFTLVCLGMATIGNFAVGSLAAYVETPMALGISAKFCLLGTILLLWKKPEILRR